MTVTMLYTTPALDLTGHEGFSQEFVSPLPVAYKWRASRVRDGVQEVAECDSEDEGLEWIAEVYR